jgi:hypothetical protein
VTGAPRRRCLAAALLSAACALACRSEPASGPVVWQTGRRAEVTPDGLHRVQSFRVDLAYLRPGASFVGYRRVLIAPVSIAYATRPRPGGRRGNFPLEASEMERMRLTFQEVLEAEFAEHSPFELVTEPGPDVLLVTAGIVDLVVNTPPRDSEGRGDVLVAVTGAMTGILDVADSETGMPLARVADRQVLEPAGPGARLRVGGPSEWQAIRLTFRRWARLLREGIEELVTAGPLPHPSGPDPEGAR